MWNLVKEILSYRGCMKNRTTSDGLWNQLEISLSTLSTRSTRRKQPTYRKSSNTMITYVVLHIWCQVYLIQLYMDTNIASNLIHHNSADSLPSLLYIKREQRIKPILADCQWLVIGFLRILWFPPPIKDNGCGF